MLNQQNRLLARLTLSALMGVAACLPTLTHAEALNFEEAAHRLQANSDRLAMTRFSVESAQLKEQATRHLGGPVVTAGAAAFRFQGAVQGIDLTPLTHTIGSSIAALPAPLAAGLTRLPPLPNSLDLSTQRSGNTSSVSAILPIYTGGATTAIKQALQAKTEEARADGRQVQQEVFNEFVQRYFGAQLAERVAGLREVAYRTVSEHDAATQRMLEAGLVAQVERLQARAAMEDAKRNALKARDDAELASTALARPIMETSSIAVHHEPWNKGKIVGQKAPFKVKDIWALRVRLQMEGRVRELALFNLGIDSKLRGCDLVSLKVRDVSHGDQVATRAIVMQHKTKRPVQFEITAVTREALQAWIRQAALKSDDFLFPSRLHESPHLGTRQYARILGHWVDELGLDRAEYGTHSIRRTKATLIYRRTKNLRAVQLLLGHSKLESTVKYLGIEVDDALEISEQTEI